MPAIKDNLRTLRNISGLSQSEAAEALHVTRQTISSYETGRTEPDLEMLKALAELYHADVHDVMYGGNRVQRKIRHLRAAVIAAAAILLLCLLIHSVMYLVINTLFAAANGTAVTPENMDFIHTRFVIRDAADIIARIGVFVFDAGSLILLYPIASMRKVCPAWKMLLWLLGLVAAVLLVTVPFAMLDKTFGIGDYLIAPMTGAALSFTLLFLMLAGLSLIQIGSGKRTAKEKTGGFEE